MPQRPPAASVVRPNWPPHQEPRAGGDRLLAERVVEAAAALQAALDRATAAGLTVRPRLRYEARDPGSGGAPILGPVAEVDIYRRLA